MKRPYSLDWQLIDETDNLYYSARLNLWWKDGKVYDETSARHNGIIGLGATLRKVIEATNEEEAND